MYAQIESVMDERRKVGLPLMFNLGYPGGPAADMAAVLRKCRHGRS